MKNYIITKERLFRAETMGGLMAALASSHRKLKRLEHRYDSLDRDYRQVLKQYDNMKNAFKTFCSRRLRKDPNDRTLEIFREKMSFWHERAMADDKVLIKHGWFK